jgi:alpha-methylacyl-CoA racemase
MTGWGQSGRWPRAPDTTSITSRSPARACTRIGHEASRAGARPLNLVGDFGGGGMLLAFGNRGLRAAREARTSGSRPKW